MCGPKTTLIVFTLLSSISLMARRGVDKAIHYDLENIRSTAPHAILLTLSWDLAILYGIMIATPSKSHSLRFLYLSYYFKTWNCDLKLYGVMSWEKESFSITIKANIKSPEGNIPRGGAEPGSSFSQRLVSYTYPLENFSTTWKARPFTEAIGEPFWEHFPKWMSFFFFVSSFVKILLIHIISKLVVLLTARAIVVSRNAII